MNLYQGGCLCGACRYLITGEKPEAMYFCHCSRCRKETGTIHAANIFFNKAHLAWEKGQDNIAHFKLKGTQKQRAFCMTCGSPLPRVEDACIVLPAGTLDDNNSPYAVSFSNCSSLNII